MEKPSGPVLIRHWSESEQYSVIQTLQIQIQIHSNTNTTHATIKCKYKYVIHADTKKYMKPESNNSNTTVDESMVISKLGISQQCNAGK